jgi:hypothetical protein
MSMTILLVVLMLCVLYLALRIHQLENAVTKTRADREQAEATGPRNPKGHRAA